MNKRNSSKYFICVSNYIKRLNASSILFSTRPPSPETQPPHPTPRNTHSAPRNTHSETRNTHSETRNTHSAPRNTHSTPRNTHSETRTPKHAPRNTKHTPRNTNNYRRTARRWYTGQSGSWAPGNQPVLMRNSFTISPPVKRKVFLNNLTQASLGCGWC